MTKETTKRSFLLRRTLAVLMVVMLVVSIVAPNIVWAEETIKTTNGYYDANGEWHEGGNGVFEYPEANLTLSKTAKPVEGLTNIFEITLGVELKLDSSIFAPSSLATVLIIDVSGSMDYCAYCGGGESLFSTHLSNCPTGDIFIELDQTRMYAARQAAYEFIDALREDAPEGSGRYVTLVSFSNNATDRVATWQDVTTTAGYNAVNNAISNLSAGGGTNLDDALGHASDLLDSEDISAVSKGGRNVVVLTDGTPTYYMTPGGTRGGNGEECTKTLLDDTIVGAAALKQKANVFTVCYNAANSSTYSGGPTVGNFLKDSVATPATDKITYAYNVENASELINSFMSIIDIEVSQAGVTITDPLPDNMFIPDNGAPEGVEYIDGTWSLYGVEPKVEEVGDKVIYTYTIVYKIEVDPYAEGMQLDDFYPANKPTQLILSDNEHYDFPVPGIKITVPEVNITFNSGEHGSIEGEDDEGNFVYEDVKYGTDTPTPPEVTPDDGWYFVGWTPEVNDDATEDIVYTAIYSQKQVITATGNSDSVTYNGAEHTVSGFTITGLPQGWTVSGIDYSVSGKDADTYTGVFNGTPVIRNEKQEIVPAEQYTLVLTAGTLTIEKRDLTITADSNNKEYDGTALTDNGWTVSGLVGNDNIASVIVIGSQTLVGQSANVASGAVVMNGNADVTGNYNITYIDGTLEVTTNSNEITITADSSSKTYDGTPLKDSGYTFTQGVLAQGDVLTVVVEGSQTNAGISANKVVSYKVMRGNDDVTNFYTFATPVDGVLTVEKRDLTITADSANKAYDGTVLKDNGWKDTAPAGLADGDTVASVVVEGGQLIVGSSANVASDAVIMRGNDDVTANYNITYIDGTLTVNTVGTPITITANSNSKIYDGLPLVDGGFTFTQGVLADGDVLMVEVAGSQTDAGTGVNTVVSYKVMRNGVDVTDFYTFAVPVDGTLTVEKRDLIITADSATKEYDSEELTDYGWLDTPPTGLASTDELVDVIIEGSQRVVGSSANVATYAYIMRGYDDVTDNYNITFVDGTLTVTKNTQTITITADSASKEYDGFPLTNDNYTFTDGVIGIFDRLIVEVEGSQTNAGSSPNRVVSYKVVCNGEDVTEYYTFAAPVDGTLTVTKVTEPIIIEAFSDTKEYDGTPLTNDEFYFNNYYVLAIGDGILVEIEGSQTFVGTSTNKVVSIKVMRDGVDVTDNYNIGTPIDGTLTVTKIESPIVIEANSASKEYDGTPLTNNGFTVIYDYVLVNGDEVVAVVEGSQTNVGSSENKVVSYKIMNGDKDVTDCYTIDVSTGILEVTSKSDVLTITAVSDSKTYDGTPLVNGGYSFTQGILADGDVLVVDVNGSQTFVGTSVNDITSYKVMRGNDDVTANYTIETVDGILEVTKRDLVITADSASKVYDGSALTDNGWNDTAPAGLADGDTVASVVVVGSQAEVGQSANVASDAVVMRGNEDVTANYNITYIDGTLTVSKVGTPIIITVGSASKEYDGTPLTSNSYTFTQGVLAQGDELVVVIEGSQTNAGISANKVVSYKVMRGGVDVTDFYTFATPVDGTLEITKRDVTITAASDSKEYDGTEFENNSYTADGLVEGEYIDSITVVGSQFFAGSSANVASGAVIMGTDGETTDNYNITYVDGTLTVEKKSDTVTITADSASKEYDGTPLTNDSYTVTGELADGDEVVVVIEGSQTFVGSSDNVVVSIKVIRDGVDVTDNYENLIPADGTLTIEKIETPIIITAGSSEKDYDGTPLTDSTYTFTEGVLIEGDELVVVIEGSQTEVGSSANKVVSVKVMRGEIDVTDCYTIDTFVDGELVINAIPETGDNTNITIWNVMMFASLLTLFVLAFTARRKQRAR